MALAVMVPIEVVWGLMAIRDEGVSLAACACATEGGGYVIPVSIGAVYGGLECPATSVALAIAPFSAPRFSIRITLGLARPFGLPLLKASSTKTALIVPRHGSPAFSTWA